jgi:hypothetical protein
MAKDNHFEEANQFISESMQFLNKLRYLHWNTDKYSFHIATEKIYKDWEALLDSFVEKYIGSHVAKKKHLLLTPALNNITIESLLNDDVSYLLKSTEGLKSSLKPSSLLNVIDEFQNTLFQLNYLLSLE